MSIIKKIFNPSYWLIICILPFLLKCTANPDKKIDEAIELYRKGNKSAIKQIEMEFMRKISSISFDETVYKSNGTCLYYIDDNTINIIHPEKSSFSIDSDELLHFTIDENYFVGADSYTLNIFESDGSHIDDIPVGEKDNKIKAVAIFGDKIIYYMKEKLYVYDILNESTDVLTSENFSPPFKKYYSVILHNINNNLIIITGIAGKYYMSVYDLENDSILVKNISLSSSKFELLKENIFYIFGNTGSWNLTKFNLSNKNKSKLSQFNDLIDIELTQKGVIFEDRKGLWAESFNGNRQWIPLPYALAGKYNSTVILKYNERLYLAEVDKLIMGIMDLKTKIPEIFKIEKK